MGDIGPVRAHYEVLPEPIDYAPVREIDPSPPRKVKTAPRRKPDDARRDAAR